MDEYSCTHCGKSTSGVYRCNECEGQPLCLNCAKEAGLFGIDVLRKEQEARMKRDRQKVFDRRFTVDHS